jgi:CRP-like cAMP-binding protein
MAEFHHDKILVGAPVAERIAAFLLRTLDTQQPGFGSTIGFRLSRRDIAERIGATVETVIRVLSSWSQNGWISTDGQRITIHNRSALEWHSEKPLEEQTIQPSDR